MEELKIDEQKHKRIKLLTGKGNNISTLLKIGKHILFQNDGISIFLFIITDRADKSRCNSHVKKKAPCSRYKFIMMRLSTDSK